MSIWITSDLHLGHRSVLWMNHRPFADPQAEDAVQVMNEGLIANHYCPVSLDALMELFRTVPLVYKSDRHNYDERI